MARLRIPEVLPESEQAALLCIPNLRYPTGERNRLLLRVMLNHRAPTVRSPPSCLGGR